MKPAKERLVQDLLDDGQARRAQTLLAGGRILRRRRRFRVFTHSLILALTISLTALLLWPKSSSPSAVASFKTPAPPPLKSLTDEELLALFPNTPVGLATLSNGKKKLIFPRPGDQERFVHQF